MKVSEDRFPLLFVYFEDQEDQYDVRTRTLTKGAAEIIGRWPHYVTFVSYMSVIGLLSLLLCFILSALVLSFTTSELHNPRRFSIAKCDNRPSSIFRLTTFDHLADTENATFIVEVDGNDSSSTACAIESYITWTSLPVYHVRLITSKDEENVTSPVFREFEKKFKNYKAITIGVDSFLSGTTFANSKIRNETALRFVSKVLISWNFGGTVLDSDLVTLSNFDELTRNPNDSLVMGVTDSRNVLISTKRVCHSFVFSLMKYITKEGCPRSERSIVEAVREDFCSDGRNCSSVRVLSDPFFCESPREGCVFARSGNRSEGRPTWDKVCPLAMFYL